MPVGERGRRRLLGVVAATAGTVLVIDQVTKALVVARLDPGEVVPLLGPVLKLTLLRNSGAAFSFATGATWIFTLIAITVIVVVVRAARRRLGSLGWAFAFGLLLAGAGGNLVDRLVRSPGFGRGHVVDFLVLPHWPVFNVADSAICTAAGLAVLLSLRGIEIDGRRSGARPASDGEGGTGA